MKPSALVPIGTILFLLAGFSATPPAVSEVACFGIAADELQSEAEIALSVVVVPGQSLQPEALARFINDNAPYFFVPRYIDMVDELPYTPTNKRTISLPHTSTNK